MAYCYSHEEVKAILAPTDGDSSTPSLTSAIDRDVH